MRKSRRTLKNYSNRKENKMAAEQEDLFPGFTFEGDTIGDEEPDEETTATDDGDGEPAPVDEEKEALKKKLEQNDKRFDEILDTMLRNQEKPQAEQPQNQFQEMEVPNPVEDPEGFSVAVQHNAEIRAKREIATLKAQQEETESASKAWTQFQESYPELAEYEEIVEAVSSKIAKDLAAEGVDYKRYMQTRPDKFFEKVAERMRKIIPERSEPDADRTGGLVGSGGPGKPKKAKKKGEEAPPSMVSELKKLQMETGLF